MRPEILNPLFRSVTALKGVGPKLGEALARLVAPPDREAVVADVLFHLPSGIVDRRRRPGVARSPEGAVVTLHVRVDRHEPPRGGRGPYRVFASDETGEIALVFFHAKADWLERLLPVGATRWVSGKVEWFNGRPQMVHPDHVVAEDEIDSLPAVEPVYPLTEGIGQKSVGRAAAAALEALPAGLAEWQDAAWIERKGWPPFAGALARLHRPRGEDAEEAASRARLAYDELLANQLALGLVRARARRTVGRVRKPTGALCDLIRAALPFAPTASQERAIAEIAADLASPNRMLRLLQGDVGSGKTLVGLFAAAMAIESGSQAALMAPTELLARQHHAAIAPYAAAAGIEVAILTGRERGRDREATLEGLASGRIGLVVGTHALFQTDIAFADLALAIVDEQHRFGVHQRLALTAKGRGTDILVMTATPIPRTLVLGMFGDMDVSKLTEKPAGRRPIDTRVLPTDRMDDLVARLRAAVAEGQKAYWVCPLVEESEASDLAAAESRRTALAETFGPVVGLVHGRQKAAEKDAAMADFREGRTRVLVATTVVEVGVDVPDATIMVIEHAERFGLAQLHQLRGRVGRSDRPSTCLLLFRPPLGPTAEARLRIMRETEDGFLIAEEDLRLRGEGELLGTRQSGAQSFRIADLALHADLVEAARDDARLVLATDPDLIGPRGAALRALLYLFRRDEAIRLLRSG
ncbi:ATP-dependent DNA helicase RecG [Pseudoxanthobacter soli DSM 19599]|uniref:ATP-dependent DNA helicase RecG n=1 Tax=Pseudoxanthobacter soli DSM 19599 TaxID=1123029 RepID=A0A1M7Z6T6_9HYPH|nr:ATP-dependent DNA helicase RecG [Pseudoxanthobacter soli]SHO60657.1 ATP-dependent DNA helicase RecG [Pseudoxanthobacter soli DSM 19599]